MRVTRLDPEAVPPALQDLIPLAERWGIGDDHDREAAVDSASEDEQQRLVAALDEAPDDLWSWLAGPASHDTPTPEYVAFTCLTMAADSARLKVGRHS